MSNQELTSFIKEALQKGKSRLSIAEALKEAGWDEQERKEALDAFLDTDFPVPVPRRRPYLSAREAFLYLVLYGTLYISAFHFGNLIFQFINRFIPDLLQTYTYDYSLHAVRMSTASLLVAFPVFLWISWLVNRSFRKHSERRSSRVRKWLTYITLFISAGIIVGSLIALLYHLLGGELTARFLLKVTTVLAIAGAIFGYYLWDLRKEETE